MSIYLRGLERIILFSLSDGINIEYEHLNVGLPIKWISRTKNILNLPMQSIIFWRICFTGCPTNLAITSSTGSITIGGQTRFTCSSTGAYPNVTYSWYSGQWYTSKDLVQVGPTYAVPSGGLYFYTCVVVPGLGSDQCSSSISINGTSIGWFYRVKFYVR